MGLFANHLRSGISLLSAVFVVHAESSISRQEIQQRVEQGALRYFAEASDPVTGLTFDRAQNFGETSVRPGTPASIAATGFSLVVHANAAVRGQITRQVAYDYALKTLRFSRDHVPRWKGWFLHFVDAKSGDRMWNSEYSSIDTALFLAGALYAAQIFPKTEVAEITHQLYAETDFEALRTDDGRLPNKMSLSMGYSLENGFVKTQWDMYGEQMILLILGLGHPTKPLPAAAWTVFNRKVQNGLMGFDQALFVHQYSQAFLDLRTFSDSFGDYFQNSVRASRAHRDQVNEVGCAETLKAGFWGFSAGLAPEERYEVASLALHQSTVCIGCAEASVMFIRDEVFGDLIRWTESSYGPQIWGRYGLTDSLDLDKKWIAQSVFGITVGPAYMGFANLDDRTSIWRTFNQIPEIQRGLERARSAAR